MIFIRCSITIVMIKTKIEQQFPNQIVKSFEKSIFIADYTEQTKNTSDKKAVEIHIVKPGNIKCFSLYNLSALTVGTVIYDKCSFVDKEGLSQTQCECVAFPFQATEKSWVLFLELKYCLQKNAIKNLNKAKKQVFATYHYYKEKEVIGKNHLAYLLVSLPQQNNVPFEGFISTPAKLVEWRKQGIIFRGVNEAHIKDSCLLEV